MDEVTLQMDGYTIRIEEWRLWLCDQDEELDVVNFKDMSAFGLATWLRDRIGNIRMRIITGRDDGCWINIDGGNVYLISHYEHAEMVDADDITKMSAIDLATWIDTRVDW